MEEIFYMEIYTTMKPLNQNRMKNLFLLPTDKPSRLYKSKITQNIFISNIISQYGDATYNQHIYITSDEEIKEDDYYLGDDNHIYCLVTTVNSNGKKIILTTDQDLIKDGVQAIDDEFLEWFVKNPSCEEVVVDKPISGGVPLLGYKIIIPQAEPKQETLEEAAKRTYQKGLQDDIDLSFYDGVRLGANYQAERMYSEEDMRKAYDQGIDDSFDMGFSSKDHTNFNVFIKQIRKK